MPQQESYYNKDKQGIDAVDGDIYRLEIVGIEASIQVVQAETCQYNRTIIHRQRCIPEAVPRELVHCYAGRLQDITDIVEDKSSGKARVINENNCGTGQEEVEKNFVHRQGIYLNIFSEFGGRAQDEIF